MSWTLAQCLRLILMSMRRRRGALSRARYGRFGLSVAQASRARKAAVGGGTDFQLSPQALEWYRSSGHGSEI